MKTDLSFLSGMVYNYHVIAPKAPAISRTKVSLDFQVYATQRRILVSWPDFNAGRGLKAEINLICPPGNESMTIVIPIGKKRFYYNRKINSLPAEGSIQYGDSIEILNPATRIGSLD